MEKVSLVVILYYSFIVVANIAILYLLFGKYGTVLKKKERVILAIIVLLVDVWFVYSALLIKL